MRTATACTLSVISALASCSVQAPLVVKPELRIERQPASQKIGINPCQISGPDYPAESRRNNEQGTTRIRFTIDATGFLIKTEIVKSSGYARLDDLAINVMTQCTFRAGRDKDGNATGGFFDVDYIWKLQ